MRGFSKKELRNALIVIGVLCVFSVTAMIAALIHFKPAKQPEFIPPAFDSAAVAGTLEETDELKMLGWSKVYREGMSYSAYICGRVLLNEQNQADLWFYNPSENDTWLKLRVLDEQGEILAETGLIKPGEYLQTVSFTKHLEDDTKITLKIMGYEPETYLSAGSAPLTTKVKNG